MNFKKIGSMIILGILMLGAFTMIVQIYVVTKHHDVKVTDKERVVVNDPDGLIRSKYLVYTDKGTFELTDTILGWRWSSSDDYGKIENTCYTIKTRGIRVPFFSWYENIEEFNEKVCE